MAPNSQTGWVSFFPHCLLLQRLSRLQLDKGAGAIIFGVLNNVPKDCDCIICLLF